jgi:hypothetical protein
MNTLVAALLSVASTLFLFFAAGFLLRESSIKAWIAAPLWGKLLLFTTGMNLCLTIFDILIRFSVAAR